MALIFDEKYSEPIRHCLWNVDYEPKKISDILENNTIVDMVDSFIRNDHIPNLLLCGPNGCGKTTLAKLLVKEYLGRFYEGYHLEIIGSLYRGKNVVSEKIDKKKSSDAGPDCPNIMSFIKKSVYVGTTKYRIVTIYDFDCMTAEAQMALRRIIEIYSQRVRFIFICNNISKIIEAIQSRTLILRLQPITLDGIVGKLREISTNKGIIFSDDVYEALGVITNCDLKQSINCLQVFSNSPHRTIEDFYSIFNIPSIKNVTNFVNCCLQKNYTGAYEILSKLSSNGYNVTDILDVLIKVLIYDRHIIEKNRASMIEETIKITCINEQSSSMLHLYRLANILGGLCPPQHPV